MPYMIYQRYITAIKQAYAEDENVSDLYIEVKKFRELLAALKIDPKLRESLLEPIAAVEEAFYDLSSSNS